MKTDTILLVEDNPDDLLFTQRALKKNSVTQKIAVARDGKEAVDFLESVIADGSKSTYQLPVLILLDLNLPKMHGLEVLRRLKTNDYTRLIPVVIFTSSREEKDLRSSYQFGANSYICKPIELERFSETIRQIAVYWLNQNEQPPLVFPG